MKFLVVDDSNAIRTKLIRFLTELGHEVIAEASDGFEAIEVYQKTKPDAVTLDIVMPECDGLTALQEILKINAGALVLMVTSAATVSNMYEATEAGASGFVIKPFVKEKVAEAISVIEKKHSEMRKSA